MTIAINPTALPPARLRTAYNAQMTASGGEANDWKASGLPAGLVMSASGAISGTPTSAPGTSNVQVSATEAATGKRVTASVQVVVS